MGVIEKRDDVYRVKIRKKNVSLYKTFKDKETAELFVWYKEKLIDEMDAFEVPPQQLFTLKDAFDLKIKSMEESGTYSLKYFQDLHVDLNRLKEYIPEDTYLNDITFEMLKDIFHKMSTTTVRKGGNQYEKSKTSGIISQISPRTLRRCLFTLSSLYSHLQSKGIQINNVISAFTPYFLDNFMKGNK